jgi:hypothetical protein
MSKLTLEAVAGLLTEELRPINTRLNAIEETLGKHTTMLDGLATDVKTVLERQTITDHRLERLEHWAEDAGTKIGVILEL